MRLIRGKKKTPILNGGNKHSRARSSELEPFDQGRQVTGFHLPGGHGLLEGRELEDDAQDGGHRAVAEQGLVIEYQVLKLAPLDGHHDGPVCGVEGGDDPLGPGLEADALCLADAGADPAAQADVHGELGRLLAEMMGIIGRDERHGLDRAGGRALSAACAGIEVDPGEKIRGMDGVEDPESAGGDHGLATATAAVANEADPALDVLAELDQVLLVGLLEEVQSFGDVDRTGIAVPDQGSGRVVESHADVERGRAGFADVFHLVTAEAEADSAMGGGPDNLAGPFVSEDVEGILVGEDGLVDEDAAELRFPLGEESLDEVLFDRDVLVVELGQRFLVNVPAQPHHRELEEPGHRRGKGIDLPGPAPDVEEDGPARQGVQDLAGLVRLHLPGPGRPFGGERPDGKEGYQRRLPLAHQKPEDLEQEFGGWRALGEFVEPPDDPAVSGPRRQMSHAAIIFETARVEKMRSGPGGRLKKDRPDIIHAPFGTSGYFFSVEGTFFNSEDFSRKAGLFW